MALHPSFQRSCVSLRLTHLVIHRIQVTQRIQVTLDLTVLAQAPDKITINMHQRGHGRTAMPHAKSTEKMGP